MLRLTFLRIGDIDLSILGIKPLKIPTLLEDVLESIVEVPFCTLIIEPFLSEVEPPL